MVGDRCFNPATMTSVVTKPENTLDSGVTALMLSERAPAHASEELRRGRNWRRKWTIPASCTDMLNLKNPGFLRVKTASGRHDPRGVDKKITIACPTRAVSRVIPTLALLQANWLSRCLRRCQTPAFFVNQAPI
jgi:hypothetical protein